MKNDCLDCAVLSFDNSRVAVFQTPYSKQRIQLQEVYFVRSTGRTETPLSVFLIGISALFRQFAILPVNASCFIHGALTGLGLFFIVVSLLPQSIYEKLAYREWIENRTHK